MNGDHDVMVAPTRNSNLQNQPKKAKIAQQASNQN